jgi:TPR repeat protein
LSAYSRLDYETALREWSESAIAGERQGEAKAQNNLGVMYENGHGLPIDLDIAIYWYEEAARKGNRNARANLHRLTTAGAAFRD